MKNFTERLILRAAIFYIRRGWGAQCLQLDDTPDCLECKAEDVVRFLEKTIEYGKEW